MIFVDPDANRVKCYVRLIPAVTELIAEQYKKGRKNEKAPQIEAPFRKAVVAGAGQFGNNVKEQFGVTSTGVREKN